MINVTFVCLGNICRSPMAELIFKKLIKDRGVEKSFCVYSCATSDEEEGNPIYPPALRTLRAHGIDGSHTARLMTLYDIVNSDYVLVMDGGNFCSVMRMTSGRFDYKVFKLCDFTDAPRDVADPWYSQNFEKAFYDIEDGCKGFLEFILREKAELIKYNSEH